MTATPEISIILPAHNADIYIQQAVESILNQTFQYFELIIIDDASTDKTIDIVKAYATTDKRISLISNADNLGLPASLNLGIERASGKYIARMDADDISHPDRLEKQYLFLEKNKKHGIVGTQINFINSSGKKIKTSKKYLQKDKDIRKRLVFENTFAHPSVMIRTSVIKDNNLQYDTNFETTQDWNFWVDILQYSKGANLPQSLLLYRIHNNATSSKKRHIQLTNSLKIQKKCIITSLDDNLYDERILSNINSIILGERNPNPRNIDHLVQICLESLEYAQKLNISLPIDIRYIILRIFQIGIFGPICYARLKLLIHVLSKHPFHSMFAIFNLLRIYVKNRI